MAADVLSQPYRAVRNYLRTDWISFATGGRLIEAHAGASMYTNSTQGAIQAALVGGHTSDGLNQYPLPPLFAFFIEPIAALPLRTSTLIWSLLLVACMAALLVLVARWFLDGGVGGRVIVAAPLVALWPTVDAIAFGQLTPLLLLPLVVAVHRIEQRGDDVMAGLCLSLLAVKPQDVWLVPVCLLAIGFVRAFAGFCFGGLVWAVSTLAFVGVDGTIRWIRDLLPATYVSQTEYGAGIPGVAAQLGLGNQRAILLAIPLAVGASVIFFRKRRVLRHHPALAVALAVVIGVLCSPHAYDRELTLVTAAFIVATHVRIEVRLALALAITVGAMVAFALPVAEPGHPVTVVTAIAVVLLWPLARDSVSGSASGTQTVAATL